MLQDFVKTIGERMSVPPLLLLFVKTIGERVAFASGFHASSTRRRDRRPYLIIAAAAATSTTPTTPTIESRRTSRQRRPIHWRSFRERHLHTEPAPRTSKPPTPRSYIIARARGGEERALRAGVEGAWACPRDTAVPRHLKRAGTRRMRLMRRLRREVGKRTTR